MRPIKFRVFSCGSYIPTDRIFIDCNGKPVVYDPDFEDFLELKECVIEQFTGLMSQGQEIYENDILELEGRLYLVVFLRGCFRLMRPVEFKLSEDKYKSACYSEDSRFVPKLRLSTNCWQYRIFGNIHKDMEKFLNSIERKP